MDESGHSGDAGAADSGDGADSRDRARLNGWATPDSPWSHPGTPLEQENDVPAWRRPAPENRPSSGAPLPAPTPPGFVDATTTGEIPPSGVADRWGETRSRYSDLLAPLAPPSLPPVPEQSRPGASFGSPAVRPEPGRTTGSFGGPAPTSGGFGGSVPAPASGGFDGFANSGSAPTASGLGSSEPGPATDGFGGSEPGQTTGGFGRSEPGQTSGSFGRSEPGQTSGGFGRSEPGETTGGFGRREPGQNTGGFQRGEPGQTTGSSRASEPGQTTGGFGNFEPRQVTGGFGSPVAARPSALRAFDVPTPSSAPPYPYEGDLDDAPPPAPPHRATTAVPLVRPAAPGALGGAGAQGGRRADWIATEAGPNARHALSQGTPVQGTPVQGTPVQGGPVQSSPVQADPAPVSPVPASPAPGRPAQVSPVHGGSGQISAGQTSPAQISPAQGTALPGGPVTGSPAVPGPPASPEPARVAAQPDNTVGDEAKFARPSYDPSSLPRGLGYEPSPAAEPPGYTPPPAYAGFGGRDAGPVRPGDPGAARAAVPADQGTRSLLPQRVPAQPDVPRVPEPPLVEPTAETPALARIATHLRRGDVLPAQERQEGFDVQAILAAVREVAGVRDASLRTTPAGAHSLRLDLAEGADPAEVSRRVARLLQDRMGLDAAMKGEALPPLPVPAAPVSPARATAPVSPPPRDAAAREAALREVAPREASRRETASREAALREALPREASSREAVLRAAPSRESSVERREPPLRETTLSEVPRRERQRERDRESASREVRSAREPAAVTLSEPAPTGEAAGGTTPVREPAAPTTAAPTTSAPTTATRAASARGAQIHPTPAHTTAAHTTAARATPARVKPVERAPERAGQHERYDDAPRVASETAIVPSGVETPPRPLYPAHDPGPRIVIENVQVNTFGTDATVEVWLGVDGRSAAGEASGPAVDGYLLRLCAMATAAAVDQLLSTTDHPEGPVRCFVEHAAAVPFGASQVAVAVLLLSWNGWVEQLAGSAVVTGDDRLAMVRATLAAVNRRLEALLSE